MKRFEYELFPILEDARDEETRRQGEATDSGTRLLYLRGRTS
jgi:hypothetical protein